MLDAAAAVPPGLGGTGRGLLCVVRKWWAIFVARGEKKLAERRFQRGGRDVVVFVEGADCLATAGGGEFGYAPGGDLLERSRTEE